MLKKWIDTNKVKREDLFITTKLPDHGKFIKMYFLHFNKNNWDVNAILGNRPEGVEKNLKKSLDDLNLSYVDLYLIHVPFGFPESTTGQQLRHPNGDLVLDLNTDHVAVWKVHIYQKNNK